MSRNLSTVSSFPIRFLADSDCFVFNLFYTANGFLDLFETFCLVFNNNQSIKLVDWSTLRTISARQGYHGPRLWARDPGSDVRWAVRTLNRVFGAGYRSREWRAPSWQFHPRWTRSQRSEPRWPASSLLRGSFQETHERAIGGRVISRKGGLEATGSRPRAAAQQTKIPCDAAERPSRFLNKGSPLVPAGGVGREAALWE